MAKGLGKGINALFNNIEFEQGERPLKKLT